MFLAVEVGLVMGTGKTHPLRRYYAGRVQVADDGDEAKQQVLFIVFVEAVDGSLEFTGEERGLVRDILSLFGEVDGIASRIARLVLLLYEFLLGKGLDRVADGGFCHVKFARQVANFSFLFAVEEEEDQYLYLDRTQRKFLAFLPEQNAERLRDSFKRCDDPAFRALVLVDEIEIRFIHVSFAALSLRCYFVCRCVKIECPASATKSRGFLGIDIEESQDPVIRDTGPDFRPASASYICYRCAKIDMKHIAVGGDQRRY